MSSEEKIGETLDRAFHTSFGIPVKDFLPPAGSIEDRVGMLEGQLAMLREALLLAGREIDDLRASRDG
jgi:hypothetical protein